MKSSVLTAVCEGIQTMPPCKQCGYPNKLANNYCVKCGSEIQVTSEILAAKAEKAEAQSQQRAMYLLAFFLLFAVIDIAILYEFPTLLIGGLIADGAITAFVWFTWRTTSAAELEIG